MNAPSDRWRPQTRLVVAGKGQRSAGAVNPPLHRASTILIDRVEDLYGPSGRTYGLEGMPIHVALEEALLALAGGAGVVLAPSGLAACTLALLGIVSAGDRILVTDSVYGPTRRFCDQVLARFGVATTYYPPRVGDAVTDFMTPDVRVLFLESPGSLTFEVQDVPALAAAARERGVITIIDDTWSGGVLFNPFDHGVDLSVQALTKHQAGHADALMGAVIARTPELLQRVRTASKNWGVGPGGPEEAYLTLRGMRTMGLRLEQSARSGERVARWLAGRPEVAAVLHPGLETHPDHVIWRRDFTGACGVFGVRLHAYPDALVARMLEQFDLFSMGFSWGGYESLIIPCDPQLNRVFPEAAAGPLLRLSIGLEHPDDLIDDLKRGLEGLTAPLTP